jgi:hypothetical protein
MLTEECVACGADVPLGAAVHMLVNPKGDEEVADGYLCRSCYEEHLQPIIPEQDQDLLEDADPDADGSSDVDDPADPGPDAGSRSDDVDPTGEDDEGEADAGDDATPREA